MSKRKNNPGKSVKVGESATSVAVELVPSQAAEPQITPQVQTQAPSAFIQDGVPEPFQFIDAVITVRIGNTAVGREETPIQELKAHISRLSVQAFVQAEQTLMAELHRAAGKWKKNLSQYTQATQAK